PAEGTGGGGRLGSPDGGVAPCRPAGGGDALEVAVQGHRRALSEAAWSLPLKRASASPPVREWSDDDYDVLCEGAVVGRINKANAAPVGSPGCGRSPSGIIRTARPGTATR